MDKSGHKLHINCQGPSSGNAAGPVVLFHHSLTGHSLDWYLCLGGKRSQFKRSWIQPEVVKFTRACSFDRTGYGTHSCR